MRTREYDVVIVGAGMTGSLIAERLGARGWRVLVLEAGTGTLQSWDGYQEAIDTFSTALAKVPNSAYLANPDAPSPSVLETGKAPDGKLVSLGYFQQTGPLPYASDYLRATGGTMVHWLGIALRMLPEDFSTGTRYGQGRDWPIGYHDLEPYYEQAELAIGVAGDAAGQAAYGVPMRDGYCYPMHRIPPSYVDQQLEARLGNDVLDIDGYEYDLRLTTTPQGRNSTPNLDYDSGHGYRPVGAVGSPDVHTIGQRCVGNSSCVPICPVQAKYNPLKTQALWRRDRVTMLTKAVATRVLTGPDGRAFGVEYLRYDDPRSTANVPGRADAPLIVLTAHAIENAKLLLASGITARGMVGQHLMDHPVILSWGLAPSPVGAFRGPGSTSGFEAFRKGPQRTDRAAFRVEISNWGWNWAVGSPTTDVLDAVDAGITGAALRAQLAGTVPRQVQLQCMVEQPADPANRVTIDPAIRDAMGNYRPIIQYNLSEYVRNGLLAARRVSEDLLRRFGSTDETSYPPSAPSFLRHNGVDLMYYGAGHAAGTHLMGSSPSDSVVDSYQRMWEVPNVYAVGCGSMPSLGTANPSLTMAALALRSAERIHADLLALNRPAVIATPQPSVTLEPVTITTEPVIAGVGR
jgi:choline dehydrogenase-like flavoprotein